MATAWWPLTVPVSAVVLPRLMRLVSAVVLALLMLMPMAFVTMWTIVLARLMPVAFATGQVRFTIAVAKASQKALVIVTEAPLTPVAFAVVTEVHVPVWELRSPLAVTLQVDLQHGLMCSLQQPLQMPQVEMLKHW